MGVPVSFRGRFLLGVGGGLVAHLEVGGLDVARGTDAELDGDVHGRPERAAVGDGDVRGVVEELALNLLVDGGALVDTLVRHLVVQTENQSARSMRCQKTRHDSNLAMMPEWFRYLFSVNKKGN